MVHILLNLLQVLFEQRDGESVPLENMADATDCGTSMVPEFNRNNFPCLVKVCFFLYIN